MKTLPFVLALGLAACTSLPQEGAPWRIEPTLSIDDGTQDAQRQTARGLALAQQGRYDAAIGCFLAAAALAPQNAYVHNNLGYAYLLKGSNELAIARFEEALSVDPQYAKAHENLRVARSGLTPLPRKPEAEVARKTAPEGGAAPARLVQVAPNVYELEVALGKPAAPLQAAQRRFRVEVTNGNGAAGMAKRVASGLGLANAHLTNRRPFVQAVTVIEFRDGYAEAAAALGRKLDGGIRTLRIAAAGDVDVRIVLGRDRLKRVA